MISAADISYTEATIAGQASRRHSPKLLLLSSSLLIDRVFLFTEFLNTLSAGSRAEIWAASAHNSDFRDIWETCPAAIREFPEVQPFKEFPYNYLRRLNEFAWDFRFRTPSRLSMWRHVRSKTIKPSLRALRIPGMALSLMRLEKPFEEYLQRLLLAYPRSPEAFERLQSDQPDLVVTTGPFQFEQPAIVAYAKKMGIPTMALVPSWDNLSTKNRMTFKYDGYLVWSEQTRDELHYFYPYTRKAPVYVVGAPQFDVFFQRRFHLSRETFCQSQGLRADLPIIVYAVGSPNFLRGEPRGAVDFARRVMRGDLGNVQVIVRPHPLHDKGELTEMFREFSPRVVLQQPVASTTQLLRSQNADHITEWVNTFKHADVVINLSSTVTVDAAIFDRPVVNLDYDPEPGGPQQQLIKDVNHTWHHFRPIAESEGLWLVNSPDEMIEAVKAYLANPELHREKRRWIAEYVCQYLDGRCGERMAEAVLDFAHNKLYRSSKRRELR
jgi:hypothetical protein